MKRISKPYVLILAFMLCVLTFCSSNSTAASSKAVPGKVSLTKASSSAWNKITVRWKKASNATHYKIYYKAVGTSRWKLLASVASKRTSYTHVASKRHPIIVGKKYLYTVRAYNSHSKKYGKYPTKGLSASTKPAAVKMKKAALNSTNQSVTVSWKKAKGCNYYLVYRKTGSSAWKRVAKVSSSQTSYTDTAPVKGQTNTYRVRGYYSRTKTYGSYSSKSVSVRVPDSSSNAFPENHTWVEAWKPGEQEIWMDWTSTLPDGSTDPGSNTEIVTYINTCRQCGYFLGRDDELLALRLLNHIETSNCPGSYTLVPVTAVYRLLECTQCIAYKRGTFLHYIYPAYPNGNFTLLPSYVELTPEQIQELGLPRNGR